MIKDTYIKGLVSVIVPAYNREEYIEKAIESIAKQTYKNIEIIICDDASTDNTKDKIEKLAGQYNNIITLFNPENMKIVKTKNRCLEVCKGEFITSQDADDYSELNKIEKQINFLEKNKDIDYVSCGMYKVNAKNEIWDEVKFREREITDHDFIKGSPAAHAPTMFRREALKRVNGYREDKTTACIEDYDLFFRMQISGIKGYLMSDILYYYRQDKEFLKRRKYKYRIDEYKIRKLYYPQLNIRKIDRLYRFKPLILGLIPNRLLEKVKAMFKNNMR